MQGCEGQRAGIRILSQRPGIILASRRNALSLAALSSSAVLFLPLSVLGRRALSASGSEATIIWQLVPPIPKEETPHSAFRPAMPVPTPVW